MTRNSSFVARRETATAPDSPSLHGASRSPTQSIRMAPLPSPSLVRAIAQVEQKLKDAEDKFKEMEEKLKQKLQRAKDKIAEKNKKLDELYRGLKKLLMRVRGQRQVEI
jgi:septin family protein